MLFDFCFFTVSLFIFSVDGVEDLGCWEPFLGTTVQ